MNDLTRIAKNNYEILDTVISRLYSKDDFKKRILTLADCKKSEYPSLCSEIVKMYKNIGIECEAKQSPQYYESLLNTVPKDVLCETKDDLNSKILETLYNTYKDFPAPAQIMKRILDNCGSEEFKNEETLRVRILKEFLKHADAMKIAGKKGEAAVKKYIKKNGKNTIFDVDDGVFELLKSANKDQLKDTYSLLVLSQELAEGKFKNSGASKEPLYLLAIVLGMKYYTPDSNDYCVGKDFVKNIFKDYYNDNLIRYITSYKNVNPSAYENEPLGLGVDYKNYAEALFIYYMNKPDFTPAEKIKCIYDMIDTIKAEGRDNEFQEPELSSTRSLKLSFMSTFLNLEEDELVDYILANYNFSTESNQKPITDTFGQNSIAECYNSIVSEICCCLNVSPEAFIKYIENSKTTTKKKDIEEEDFVSILELNQIDVEGLPFFDEDFSILLNKVNQRLDIDKTFSLYKATGETKISRTKLISAYYHFYCVLNIDNPLEFSDVLNDFEIWLNSYLEQAGFCRLDYKNVFDMLVVFFAYCRINDKLYED